MRLQRFLLVAGLVLTFAPPILFAVFAILAYRADPVDQAGWSMLVGGSLILTLTMPQVGIMVLLVYICLRYFKQRV